MAEASKAVVDLHGHQTSYVLYELVPDYLEAAWRRGCTHVTLIHGSPDVRDWWTANSLGRGSIKWGLRGALARGDYMAWVWNRRSVKHRGLEVESGAMTLALRPNPAPDPTYPWPEADEPVYEYEGPWHRDRLS